MKKFLKLVTVVFISFVFVFNVNAAGVCDPSTQKVKEIKLVNPYEPTGWDAWAYVCEYHNCRDAYTACGMEFDQAKDWCKGEYQSPGYKAQNHIYSVGECSDSNVCKCATCTTTCNLNTYVQEYVTESCEEGTAGCKCVDAVGPTFDESILAPDSEPDPEPVKKVCTKSYWAYYSSDNSSVEIKKETGGDNCAQDADLDTLKSEATEDAESACEDKESDTYSGKYHTVVSVTSKSTTCTDTHRVKYRVCDCRAVPYLVKNVREAKFTTRNENNTANIPVYCISPKYENPENAYFDYVDATQCESSNSTPDCGYANILIEGNYRAKYNPTKYNYSVIGAALRLWGAHVGAGGYSDTGIADEDDSTIDNDRTWLKFVPGPNIATDSFVNVFKETFKYIHSSDSLYRKDASTIYEVDTIRNDGVSNLQLVACGDKNNITKMGIFCGNDSISKDIYGNSGNYIYVLSLFANTVQGNKDMHAHLNELNFANNQEVLNVVKNDPISYTAEIVNKDSRKVRITYKLRPNVMVDCSTLPEKIQNSQACQINQSIVIKDKSGNIIGDAINISQYDECRKNYCYTDVIVSPEQIECNAIDKMVLTTDVYKSCGANSVKKYYACSNPADHQIMFSFEPDSQCTTNIKTTETMETRYKCNECLEDVTPDEPVINKCSYEVDKVTERSVSDPSLNCILHKSSGSVFSVSTPKHYYDYSDMFGVNTDICRVYCSDKVTYSLSGRKEVFNSFQLKYNIDKDLGRNSLSTSNHLISVIEMKRTCVSEIFYNNMFDYVKDWNSAYGIPKNKSLDNWKELYAALAEQSKHENDRKELLNKLVYDLYNCNFYNDIVDATDEKVRIPLDSVNSYQVAQNLLDSTKNYCNNNDCVKGYFKYEGGAEFINPTSAEEMRVGSTANNPSLKASMSIPTTDINVTYCSGSQCFPGMVNGKYEDNFRYFGSSQLSSKEYEVLDVKVPTNDYAVFSISAVSNIYNPVRYQVQEQTGKVQVEKASDRNKYFTIEKNTFPVSSYAHNICERQSNGTSNCEVNHYYSIPAYTEYNKYPGRQQLLFSRNNPDDNFVKRLEEVNHYQCDYVVKSDVCPPDEDCPPPSGTPGFIFRNIDLNNPVPHNRDGTNWDANNTENESYSKYVEGVIKEIKESGEDNLYATDEYLEYSFILNNDSIEEIRSLNKNTSYFELPVSCEKNESEGYYYDCVSSFLNDVRTQTKYSIVVNKGDGVSKFTEEKNKQAIGGGN